MISLWQGSEYATEKYLMIELTDSYSVVTVKVE